MPSASEDKCLTRNSYMGNAYEESLDLDFNILLSKYKAKINAKRKQDNKIKYLDQQNQQENFSMTNVKTQTHISNKLIFSFPRPCQN